MKLLHLLLLLMLRWKCALSEQEGGVGVFITISSLASITATNHVTERLIQLNWFNADPEPGDFIGLYTSDVQNGTDNPMATTKVNQPEGIFTTNISMPRPVFRAEDLRRKCLGFWIAYIRNDTILNWNCFKSEPHWMWQNRDLIGSMTLGELTIPGTHDAGSYQPYLGWDSENPFTKFKMCQEETFWSQLVYGIRHLDLRTSYYASEQQFWLTHDVFRTNKLLPALLDIRTFAENTEEILFLDFHNFPTGFTEPDGSPTEAHEKLLSILIDQLGEDLIIPKSYGYGVTLNDLWKNDKRILILYNDTFSQRTEYYWPGLRQVWANTLSVGKLKAHLQAWVDNPETELWSAQAELTPDKWHLMFQSYEGLRELAAKVNGNVTRWFRDLWWEKSNIVATDFFLGNDVIDVAISNNRRKAMAFKNSVSD